MSTPVVEPFQHFKRACSTREAEFLSQIHELRCGAESVYRDIMSNDQPNSGHFDGRAHILPVRVYYEDTDFTGLVYHASYLRFFERGRSDFLRSVGVHHNHLLQAEDPAAFAVIRMEIDFLAPARIDDAATVRTVFETMRGPRIFIAQELHRNGEILVRAKVEICCINLAGRPRKPPAALLARLKPFLEPSPSSF